MLSLQAGGDPVSGIQFPFLQSGKNKAQAEGQPIPGLSLPVLCPGSVTKQLPFVPV
jgi:hypothetical protein